MGQENDSVLSVFTKSVKYELFLYCAREQLVSIVKMVKQPLICQMLFSRRGSAPFQLAVHSTSTKIGTITSILVSNQALLRAPQCCVATELYMYPQPDTSLIILSSSVEHTGLEAENRYPEILAYDLNLPKATERILA